MNPSTLLRFALVLAATALLLASCGTSTDSTDPVDAAAEFTDTRVDTEPTDTNGATDTIRLPPADQVAELPQDTVPETVVPPNPCMEQMAEEEGWMLLPELPATQIHAAVAFDGTALWLTWTLPDDAGGWDIWAGRMACDGSFLVPPFRVHDESPHMELDSSVAVSGERVLVAWQRDDGNSPYNLSVHTRVFDLDGAPLGKAQPLALTVAGELAEGNAWMPATAPLPEGGFALAAAAALPTSTGFQAVYQALTPDGALAGEAVPVSPNATASQVYPAIAAHQDSVWVAWTRSTAEDDDQVAWARLAAGAGAFEPQPANTVPEEIATTNATLAAGPGGVFLGYQAISGAMGTVPVRPIHGEPTNAAYMAGTPGSLNHTPGLAPLPDGGMSAWYEVISGTKNALRVQAFEWDGYGYNTMGQTTLNETDAAPYPPALATVSDKSVFVVWSAGNSPGFMLYGRFVTRP